MFTFKFFGAFLIGLCSLHVSAASSANVLETPPAGQRCNPKVVSQAVFDDPTNAQDFAKFGAYNNCRLGDLPMNKTFNVEVAESHPNPPQELKSAEGQICTGGGESPTCTVQQYSIVCPVYTPYTQVHLKNGISFIFQHLQYGETLDYPTLGIQLSKIKLTYIGPQVINNQHVIDKLVRPQYQVHSLKTGELIAAFLPEDAAFYETADDYR